MPPEQVWVIHQSLEWEFSSLFAIYPADSITIKILLHEALSVFKFDGLIEPLARLMYKGEVQPFSKSLGLFKDSVLEFELVLAHSSVGDAYQTKHFSPLDFDSNNKQDEQNVCTV